MLRIDQLIACLQSSVNQQGLLADKKREGRCPSDYFFFTQCVCKTFFWLYRSVGFEGNIMYTKKGITSATECADVVVFTFAK